MADLRLWEVRHYDRRRHDLRAAVSRILGCTPLESLGGFDYCPPRFSREKDQSTPFHRAFYEEFEKHLRSLYEEFIAQVVAPIIGESFCFQDVPTFRVHLPNNVAVGEFHRDSDYAHLFGERNFWIPLTPAWDTNAVWIEDPKTRIRRPVLAVPGQIVMFDALNLVHGNLPNDTAATRVSFDFRCITMSDYEPTGATSVNAGRRLAIGDYYKLYEPAPE